jgi:hypothetical protein
MLKRFLGNSNLEVSAIGNGTEFRGECREY